MIIPHRHTKFKEGQHKELLEEFQQARTRLRIVLDDMAAFCEANNQEFVLTDIMSNPHEDKKLKRLSTSHLEGRAADIRVSSWSDSFRAKFEQHFEVKYKRWAAVAKETQEEELIVIHNNGNGLHTHVQIRPYKES
jgi:hypothetical protein